MFTKCDYCGNKRTIDVVIRKLNGNIKKRLCYTCSHSKKSGFGDEEEVGSFGHMNLMRKYADRIRPCAICDDIFEARSRRQIYCSKKCSKLHFEQMKPIYKQRERRRVMA